MIRIGTIAMVALPGFAGCATQKDTPELRLERAKQVAALEVEHGTFASALDSARSSWSRPSRRNPTRSRASITGPSSRPRRSRSRTTRTAARWGGEPPSGPSPGGPRLRGRHSAGAVVGGMAGAAIGSAAAKADSVKPGMELIIKLENGQEIATQVPGQQNVPAGRSSPVDDRPEWNESGEDPTVGTRRPAARPPGGTRPTSI